MAVGVRSHSRYSSPSYQDYQRELGEYLRPYYFFLKRVLLACFSYFVIFLFILYTIYSVWKQRDAAVQIDIYSKLLDILSNSNRSLCSNQADTRGKGQRIIALSVFGPKENLMFDDSKFSGMITPLINEAHRHFPTWTIRLYAETVVIDRLQLTNLSRSAPNIDICNVNQLPELGNVAEYLPGKLWRFLSALDPVVDFTSSRDLDSPLTEREQLVVEEFVSSPYLFLTLRDHPQHSIPVLGGLWTAAQGRSRTLFLRLFSILLDRTRVKRYALNKDQNLLTERVWPWVKRQAVEFDSFTCRLFGAGYSRAYPTKRPAQDCHLGCVRPCCQNSSGLNIQKPCPFICRPKNHQDWIYC